MNKVILVGNLGADPQIRYTQSGKAVATLSMATNEKWTDKDGTKHEQVEWHRIAVWGRLAEVCGEYLHTGSKIAIVGKKQTRKWEDSDGNTHYTTEIVTREMEMLDGRRSNEARPQSPPQREYDQQPVYNDGDVPF